MSEQGDVTQGSSDGLDTATVLESTVVLDPAPDAYEIDEIPGELIDEASRLTTTVEVAEDEGR